MLYTVFKVKDQEYKIRFGAKQCCDLEDKLGTNPLNIIIAIGDDKMPKVKELLIMLHAGLQQYQHGISMDDVYDIYDNYCLDGGNIVGLLKVIIDAFKQAGFIPQAKDNTEDNEKN